MEAVQKALEDIEGAFETAKVWTPIIFVPFNHVYENSAGSHDVNVTPNVMGEEPKYSVDIVKLMRQTKAEKSVLMNQLKTELNYPDNALFRFEGFDGNSKETRTSLKTSIFSAGSVSHYVVTFLSFEQKLFIFRSNKSFSYNLLYSGAHFTMNI